MPDHAGPPAQGPDPVAGDRADVLLPDVQPPDVQLPDVRLTVRVSGRVQGVGFRWWTRARALELGLVGSATNLPDGRVEVVAQGRRDACQRLLALLSGPGTPGRVGQMATWESPARPGLSGFVER